MDARRKRENFTNFYHACSLLFSHSIVSVFGDETGRTESLYNEMEAQEYLYVPNDAKTLSMMPLDF